MAESSLKIRNNFRHTSRIIFDQIARSLMQNIAPLSVVGQHGRREHSREEVERQTAADEVFALRGLHCYGGGRTLAETKVRLRVCLHFRRPGVRQTADAYRRALRAAADRCSGLISLHSEH